MRILGSMCGIRGKNIFGNFAVWERSGVTKVIVAGIDRGHWNSLGMWSNWGKIEWVSKYTRHDELGKLEEAALTGRQIRDDPEWEVSRALSINEHVWLGWWMLWLVKRKLYAGMDCLLFEISCINIFTVQYIEWPYASHHTGKFETCFVVHINTYQRVNSPVFMKRNLSCSNNTYISIQHSFVSLTLNHACVNLYWSFKISNSQSFSSEFHLYTQSFTNSMICLNKICGGENYRRFSV